MHADLWLGWLSLETPATPALLLGRHLTINLRKLIA
jgi:hypothetical protein